MGGLAWMGGPARSPPVDKHIPDCAVDSYRRTSALGAFVIPTCTLPCDPDVCPCTACLYTAVCFCIAFGLCACTLLYAIVLRTCALLCIWTASLRMQCCAHLCITAHCCVLLCRICVCCCIQVRSVLLYCIHAYCRLCYFTVCMHAHRSVYL